MNSPYKESKGSGSWLKFMIFSCLFAALANFQTSALPGLTQIQADQIAFEYPKCTQAMKDYFHLKYAVTIASPLFCSAVMLSLLQSGFIERMKERLRARSANTLSLLRFAFFIYLTGTLIRLPFSVYSGYQLEHQFGLSQQSFWLWAHDFLGYFVEGLIVIPLLAACLLLIRRFQRNWFIFIWLLFSAAAVAIAFVEPMVVDPYFNKFNELPESSLKQNIRILCQKSGVENPLILVADKSKQTKKINAYVNGISSSTRIVLFDNLVNDVPEKEILVVVAHELGHYRLKHVVTGLALAIAGMLPVLFLWKLLTDKFLPRLPRQWGIKSSSDPALMAVWCIVIWIAPLVIAPIPAFFSRLVESEADAYALRLCGDPLSAASAFRTLSKKNLSDPDPPAFIEFWFFSHPSLKHRIDHALASKNEVTH